MRLIPISALSLVLGTVVFGLAAPARADDPAVATAIIVFREVLEAALIVGIVMAASQGVPGRGFWVGSGVAGGIFGAIVVAGFAETLAAAMEGVGQEIFNAAILFAAV